MERRRIIGEEKLDPPQDHGELSDRRLADQIH
jgi:hypothetical protein